MSDDVIRIGRVAWELNAPAERPARRLQDSAGRLSHDVLPAALQRVVDQFSTEDIQIVIPRLHLDLGVVTESCFEARLVERLEDVLNEALVRARAASKLKVADESRAESKEIEKVWKEFLD